MPTIDNLRWSFRTISEFVRPIRNRTSSEVDKLLNDLSSKNNRVVVSMVLFPTVIYFILKTLNYVGQQFTFFLLFCSPSVSFTPLLSSTSVSSTFLSNLQQIARKKNELQFPNASPFPPSKTKLNSPYWTPHISFNFTSKNLMADHDNLQLLMIFLYSHHASICKCIDIVGRDYRMMKSPSNSHLPSSTQASVIFLFSFELVSINKAPYSCKWNRYTYKVCQRFRNYSLNYRNVRGCLRERDSTLREHKPLANGILKHYFPWNHKYARCWIFQGCSW